MIRAECLYRVSTKGQVDHDDIPMQKIECRKYAEQQGWTIVKELQEKGVSGFKISADKRDAIQELREDAVNHKFEVLLVFMFDRLGRRDDETPFVVEWFAKQGIRIFSVKEGEQKFESHTDSLINYIRYWQSEGESKKTSVRIKTRHDQMRQEGLYTGGPIRYGYRAVNKGRVNKKNKPVSDLEIDPIESAVVREVFTRTVYEGEGSFTLAKELNDRGFRTHKGSPFQCRHINNMLHEKRYIGYMVTKDVTSVHLPELQIIDEETFRKAQEILEQRKLANNAQRTIPRRTSNQLLLSGNLYCAACGKRMTSSNPNKLAKRPYPEYICYMGANHRVECDGQRTYKAEKVDQTVIQVATMVLNSIRKTPKEISVESRLRVEQKAIQRQLNEVKKKLNTASEELEALEMEVAKCLLGKSDFNNQMLSRLIDGKAKERKRLADQVEMLEQQSADQKKVVENIAHYYDEFISWSMEFGLASPERKRMIIAQLFSRIELGRGYEMRFEVNWNYRQFLEGSKAENKPKDIPKLVEMKQKRKKAV